MTYIIENKEYKRITKLLKVLGVFLLIIGVAGIVAGMADFFINISNNHQPKLFFLIFIGFGCATGGIICSVFAGRRNLQVKIAAQNPPMNPEMQSIIDETNEMMAEAAKAAKPNVVEGVNANTCKRCGQANRVGAKFCCNCGAQLFKKCPYCGTENDDGAKYCNSCGKLL